jgi:pimeloyl-ACP methyl ester carboxylesterase
MTAANIIDDLHSALAAAKITTPVIIVSHSIGGVYATLYTDKYFESVAGLVLVDPSFAGQDPAIRTQKEQLKIEADLKQYEGWTKTCAEIAKTGQLGPGNPSCRWTIGNDASPAFRSYIEYQYSHPFQYESWASEYRSFHAVGPEPADDVAEEYASKRTFTTLPMVILTAGNDLIKPTGVPDDEFKASSELWISGHAALAARSSNSQSIIVQNSSHFIQADRPQAVIDAIQHVLLQARSTISPNSL